MGCGKPVHYFEIAHAAVRVSRLEPYIETGIAFGGEFTAVVVWPIEAHASARRDDAGDMREQALDFRPRDDVDGVGVEDGVWGC